MSAIEVSGVTMRFSAFTALNNISATVDEGEFVTLLGPSGCGKTTLLKLISGFLHPTSGTIAMSGKDITRLPPEARDTAMCFQSYALFPHLTVKENLRFGLREKRVPADEQRRRLDPVIAQLGLEPQLDKLPNQLSGGQQQRVALGRALVMQPKVILFDEPLSNLDAKLREIVRVEIRRIQQQNNLTAIYVTHDQAEALAMSDRIVILNSGKIEQIGTPRQVYHEPRTSFVADFIGSANVMDAVVKSGEGKTWNVDTPLGALELHSERQPAGRHIKIAWRPEAAVLNGNGPNRVTVRPSHSSFQGSYTDIFFASNDREFRVQLREIQGEDLSREELAFSIPPQQLKLLEAVA